MSDDVSEEHSDLPAAAEAPLAAVDEVPSPDLDVIEADLADVEIALERLDTGEYWRDEITGEPLDDVVLEHRPTARRNTG